jgi:simple sugar transport system substrate-binding protein
VNKGRAACRLALIGLLCALLLGGCAPSREPAATVQDESQILLGFSQLGSESAWRIGNTISVQEAAKRAGVQLMFENAEQKQEKQIKAIRSFIAYQVDVIAFSPIVEDGWDNVLQEAKAAGIPVLTTDRRINTADDSLIVGFVGSDFSEEGRSAGRFVLKKMADAQHVNIVEISGTLDSTPMRQRAAGFREILGDDDRFEIIESVSGDFLRSKGKECMQGLLSRHDDIDVLYSHNDAMTLGAIEAIEEAGLVPGRDIVIITVDGEQAAIDLLKEGKINCVVECTPLIGDMIMELTKKLAAGESIPRNTYSEEKVFSEFDTDLDSLPARGY